MDAKTLSELLSNTRLKGQSRKIAKAVIVDGNDLVTVARDFGVSRQRVRAIVKRVMEEEALPDNWVCLTVMLPPDLAEQVKDMEKQAKDNLL